jgi:prepilin-type N-terminal cleavage/methylation domain-containing protein
MVRHGFTLIEVLAVVAILAVITALVMPAVENRLEAERFSSAGRQMEAAIVMARAEAQRRGVPLTLTARAIASGETGLFVEAVPGVEEGSAHQGRKRVEEGATSSAPAGDQGSGASTMVRAADAPVVVIGAGVRVTARAPSVDSGPGLKGQVDGVAPPVGSTESDSVVIARFMPDGTAIAAGPVYLVGAGTAAAYTVNRWTGSASVRVVDGASATKSDEPRSDTPEAPPPATGADAATGPATEKKP